MKSASWKRQIIRYAPLFVGGALLAALLTIVDFNDIAAAVADADPQLLLIAIALNFVFIVVKSVRWTIFVRHVSISVSWFEGAAYYQAGAFLALISPGKVGDFMKAGYLTIRHGAPLAVGAATVVTDRAFDLIALACITLAVILFIGDGTEYVPSIMALFGVLAVCIAVLHWRSAMTGIFSLVDKLPISPAWTERITKNLSLAWDTIAQVRGGLAIVSAVLSLAAYGLLYGAAFALALALDLDLQWHQVVYCITVANIVSLLPVSFAGVGTRDVTIVLLFSSLGIDEARALAFSMGFLISNVIGAHALGAIYFFFFGPAVDEKAISSKDD